MSRIKFAAQKTKSHFLRPQDSIHHGDSEQHHKESTMFFASFTMLSPRFIIIFKCCKRLAAAGGSPSVLRKSLDDLKAQHLAASLMHARSSSRLCSADWRWAQCSRRRQARSDHAGATLPSPWLPAWAKRLQTACLKQMS